jgi:hypothetical protein
MIGFFKFDEQPSVAKSLVLAHAVLNEGIKGYFYVKEMDCKDTSSVSKDSEFFGVLDDASGFGACLFVKDLQNESDAMLLQQNLHVKGNSEVDGNEAIKGNLKVDGQITGKSTVTKLIITADDMALLAAQITTMPGPMAAATLNHVTVEMQNG